MKKIAVFPNTIIKTQDGKIPDYIIKNNRDIIGFLWAATDKIGQEYLQGYLTENNNINNATIR